MGTSCHQSAAAVSNHEMVRSLYSSAFGRGGVDPAVKQLSLSLRRLRPSPFQTNADKYQVRAIVSGTVRNMTTYAAIVDLEEGIEGMIHISDMSWGSPVSHPNQILKKG